MKKILLTLVSFCLLLIAQAAENPILVSPQWVNDHQKDANVVIVQVNFMQFDYDNEHIAGARYLWPGWLAPDSPNGAMNAPDPEAASKVLQSMGVSNDSHIVLCHVRNEVSATARMFLTLESLGLHGQVSFLNGGLEAWKKAGYPVTKEIAAFKKGTFKTRKTDNFLVDKDYVLKTLSSDKGVVVDARLQRFYDGEPTGNPRDGHITGAKNIPYTEMVNAENQFKEVSELTPYFAVTPDKNKEIVAYCFIGQTASVVYMAGRILGYNMKVYDGSLQEWSRIPDLPMEVTKK